MATQQEVQLFDALLDEWLEDIKARDTVLKARERNIVWDALSGLWIEITEEIEVTPEVLVVPEKEPEALDILETPLSEAITWFGVEVQEAAREEIIPATGREIPFTEESKLRKNIKPSIEKAIGSLLEVVWSPIESTINLWSTLKAVLVAWVEDDPILWRFIKSSEWDKAIQEALTWAATKFKETVREEGLWITINKAIQEDPFLWIWIIASLFKKLGRLWKISKSEQNKINKLEKKANENIEQFLKPTKITTKQVSFNYSDKP